ncbi:rod shape-determining protein [Haloplasma contractile]|uniref:Cell shape-determining protein MreB n=1 Tax=Haloplasma contractile SSD-17B TaxID=1033810 RepID=U2DQI8_9MOLU|nr:rod shape-determining protein [Haloplasma contractile]ERJ10882.1 MreB-like protein [Haloplasma contractile SSD-17B]
MAKKGYKIGVDLGTANTLVYINGHGLIYNEPSIVAFDKVTGKCIAAGNSASLMDGKQHERIRVVKPLEGGVISDLDATKANLLYVFDKLEHINVDFKKSTLLICCPSEVSTIERVAMKALASKMGINDVFIEQEVKAGAIGAGIDIFAARGSMVIDIGGGSTDIGVLALGDLVVAESVRVAGNYIDRQIIKYVKMNHNMLIGFRTAEKIKVALGTVKEDLTDEKEFTYAGRNLRTGIPCRHVIKESEVQRLTARAFESILNIAKKVLQQTPAELAADIFNDGVVINGGGALIGGVKEFFERELNLPVRVAENPLTSIVNGTKLLLSNRGNYLIKPVE